MDCQTFRARLLIDPFDPDPALRAHANACPACARAAAQALAFEVRLRAALAEPGRVDADPAVRRAPARPHPRARRLAALLATPLVGVALWWLGSVVDLPPLQGADPAALVIAHVEAERDLLDAGRAAGQAPEVPVGALGLLLRGLGLAGRLRLDLPAARLRFAARCRIGFRDGLHLILDGERGPVTALLLPGQRFADAPRGLHAGRFDVLLLMRGADGLALVGEAGEPLAAVGARFRVVGATPTR